MKSVIKAIIVMSIMGVIIQGSLYAKEEETSNQNIKALISFALTAEDRFAFEVKVSEGGYLYDGNQRITNGIMEYQLSVGEKKKFLIEPERGYEVKQILLNKKQLDPMIQEVVITGVSASSTLEVEYGKIKRPVEPDTENREEGSLPEKLDTNFIKESEKIPETVDEVPIREYIGVLLIVLYGIYRVKKGIDTVGCVDNIEIPIGIEKRRMKKEEKKNEK